jgi:hypothetical protein
LNKSPTGALIEVSGLNVLNGPQGQENEWHHDYNGVYCIGLGSMLWVNGTAWYQSGLCNGDLQWTMGFQGGGMHGDCGTGGSSRHFDIRQQKRTITDNWWTTVFLFCGSGQVVECETSYSLSNLFPQNPEPFPDPGTPEYAAWLQSLQPAKACCCPEYESWQWPSFNGYGGTLSFIGFCDYMSLGFDTMEINYINGGTAAHCRWRFALWGGVNGVATKRMILKGNIACDFFRMDFLGSDWDIFQGNTLIPLSPDGDGFFEHTVQVPGGSTVSDFGITNTNAYNWKYKGISDVFGSVWSS